VLWELGKQQFGVPRERNSWKCLGGRRRVRLQHQIYPQLLIGRKKRSAYASGVLEANHE